MGGVVVGKDGKQKKVVGMGGVSQLQLQQLIGKLQVIRDL